jgi:hypothetical protein
MSRRIFASLLVVSAAIAGAAIAVLDRPILAAPEPSLTPMSWELTFKHKDLERLIMTVDGKEKTYWYMLYTVVNNTKQDVLFTPSFEITGDSGAVSVAFKDVSNDVFKKIKELYKNPLLQSPTDIYGKLLQGEDNAKDGVIIFSDVDTTESRNFKLFVSGLSGETAAVENPLTHAPADHPLHKTLELDYDIPGEAIGIAPRSLLRATKWVMK